MSNGYDKFWETVERSGEGKRPESQKQDKKIPGSDIFWKTVGLDSPSTQAYPQQSGIEYIDSKLKQYGLYDKTSRPGYAMDHDVAMEQYGYAPGITAKDVGYSPSMKASYDSFLSGREKSKPMPEAVKSQIGDLQKQIDALTGKISFAQENYDTVGAKSLLEQQRQLQTKLYQLQADNAESEYDRYMAQYKLHNQSFLKLLDGDGSGATSEDYRNYLENDKAAVAAKDNAGTIDYIAKYADKERKDNFGGQFAANYDLGTISQDSAIAWDDYLDDPTEENRKKAEALSVAAQEYQAKNAAALDDENAVLPWITKSLASYLPQFFGQQAMQIPLGIITAVATLNPANYKYGATVGSGVYSYRTMRGAAYRSLLDAGVPEEKARAAAKDEAVISSLIEMGETFLSLSAFGMNKLTGGAVGNAGAKIAGALESKLPSSAARALLKAGKALAAYGINIFSESQEERSQEAVSIANENRDYTQDTGIGDLAYAALKKYIGGFTGSGATEEEIARMKESEAEGAKLAAMLGGVETAQAAILNWKSNASAKRYNSDINSIIDEGMESPEGTKSRKYAEEAKKKVDAGKTLPGYQIRELVEANTESIISQDVGKITKAVEKQLTDRGYEGGNTTELAAAIAKTVAGQDTTRAERNAIKSSEQAKQILQEIAGASDVVQKYAESGASYQAAEQKAELAGEQMEQAQNDVSMDTDFQTAAENFRAADEKRTAAKEAFDAAQNEYENGSTAWARQIGARVVGDGVLSENSVEGYAHLFGKHAKLFTEAYEDGQDARQYTIEFAKAYNEGTKGGNLQALIDSGSLQNLSTVQINAAYQAGLDARNSLNTRRDTDGLHLRQSSIWENGANSTADVQEVEANAEQDQKRNADSGRKTAAEKAAGFTAEKAYRRVTTLEELGVKDAKAGIKVTQVSSDYSDETAKAYEMCAQNGVKCIFFTGGYLQTKDGIIARGANKDGVVYIRADDPNFTANEIAGHEIGHELVNRGSLDMDAVISEVRKEYTKEELSKIVDDYGLDFLASGVNEDELTDITLEEITCDALGGMNAFASNREGNAEFVQKLQGLAEKHYTVKTGETTFARQNGAEQKLSAVNDSAESRISDSTRRDLEKSGLTVQDGVVVADNLAKQMREEGYEKPVDVFDIGEKFSVVTEPEWRKSFLKNGGSADVAELMRTFTENMVANDAIASIVPMGQYSKSKFGPLRANIEYMFSFDMDTSCPRTFQFINYRDRLQKMAGRPLTFNESINLMNIMKLMGQQIPCTYCYVENKRAAKSAAYLNYFAARDAVMSSKTRQEALTKMYSYDAKKGTVSAAAQKVFDQWWEDVENGSAFHPDATTAWTAWSDSRNAVFNYLDALKESGAVNLTGAGRKTSRKALQNMALRQFGIKEKIGNSTNPAANEIINFVQEWEYDTKSGVEHKYFTENSADASVQEDMLTVHRLANNYSSSATSAKTVENYTPYVDQLKAISPEMKKYMMGMGGIRKHSSNDFRIDYVQDYFLFYADLARDGWTGHTYTKSIDFCKIFGRCGDRINLSIAFDTDTENGKIIENDQEGAPHREARKIRAAYENVGVMAMVTDNAQLSYVLNSDWIDMCIPFHASGLPKAIWYNMKAWCDYTTKQLESFLTTDEMRQALIDEKVDIPAKATKEDIAKLYNSTFGIKQILSKAGTPVRPHFFPNDTIVNGQLVPGHHNNVDEYFRLCREYGVHPRFYNLQVTDKSGKLIPVTEHPGYVKLIKETSRTDTEQQPIRFNFNEVDPYLGMSPMDYAMQEMEAFGKINGYETNKQDPMGIVPKFAKDYLGKDRPAGYVSPTFKRDIAVVSKLDAHHEMYDADMEAFYSFRPTDNTKENEQRNGAEQKFSTVNSTQLALENPDVYDEIQVTYDEILQKTKGKDLEAALLEEAQKHREDLQMWEHEAAVLTKLWKQSEKNEGKLSKAISERRDRIAEVSEELRERRRDVRTMENEFIRVVREWEKQTWKLEGKTNEAASLKQALKDSIREHRQDNAAWDREYDRLLKMYERNDRQIDRLEADIAHRKEMAAKGVEGRKRTVIWNKILGLNKDFQRILDHPGKGYTAHAPRELIKPIAEFCGMFANAEYGYRTDQLNQAMESGNSQERLDQITRAQSLLANISRRYTELSKASGLAGASYTQETADQIARATELISDMFGYRNIHEMNSDELTVVYNAMKSIMHSIKTANRLTAMETTRTLVETVDRFNKNIDEATPASRMSAKYAQRYLMWQMSPHEFFQYICGYAKDNVGLDIDRMFKRGTEKMLGVQRDFDNLFNPILNQDDKEIRRMTSTKEKDLVTVGLKDRNGNEVKLTRGMRLSVYMMLSQEDGLHSIAYGGFALPRIEEYYHGNISAAYGGEDIERLYTASQGGTIYEAAKTLQSLKEELKEARDDAQRESLRKSVNAAQERLDSLVAGEEARLIRMREDIWDSFSDYEKQLVNAANQWMEHSGNLMQETYYELNGFDPVRVNHYWPIHRDPTTIQSLDTTAVSNEINLANSGFTKSRVKAKNPILLTDFFQELMSSKQKMSRYYGFAVVQRDFNKLYMFTSSGNGVSVKKRIMAKFQSGTYKIGVSAEQYIDNYIKSVSGANKADGSWLSDLYSRSAGATLTANARVALSQLASIPTAAAVVGWKNAAIGFSKGLGYALSKQAKDQLAGDSVWFYQRYKGEGSTREIADMRNSGGLAAKAMNSGFARKYLNWCQNMDVLATGPIIWEMAKSSVLETGMKETDPGFKAAVQDKYADIIRFSQPNYTETERSDLLRDKRVGSKILTMYKTQSNQNLNILVGASLELRKMKSDFKAGKNGVTAADVKAATAKCVSAYTAVAIGNTVLFPIMRFIGNLVMRNMKPYKDDETGEVDLESVMDGILKDAFSSMAGTVAMGSILYDGVYAVLSGERYYGISDNAVGLLSDTLTSMVTLGQSITSGKNVTDKAVKMLLNLASSFGIPAKNLKNLAAAAYGWANQLLTGGPNVFDATDTTSKQDNARFVSAVLADNEEKAGNELSYLISKSDEPNLYLQSKDAASNVKSYLKDQFEERRISEDEATKVLRYLEYEDEDIKADIKQWKCVVETGIKYGNIGKSVMKGIITEDYAVELYMTYGGLSESKAIDKVYVHVFNQTYPKLSDLSEAQKLKFRDIEKSGISADRFAAAVSAISKMESDKDKNGKPISGSKKEKVVRYIQNLSGLSSRQKKILWDSVKGDWTDKDTPWG